MGYGFHIGTPDEGYEIVFTGDDIGTQKFYSSTFLVGETLVQLIVRRPSLAWLCLNENVCLNGVFGLTGFHFKPVPFEKSADN